MVEPMTGPSSFIPSFPPLLRERPVLMPDDPLDAACQSASAGDAAAGDAFWSCSANTISLAFVLEPEVERPRVQEMLFVLMVAAADSLGSICPPELAITWDWPNAVYGNRARLGTASLVLSEAENASGQPDWAVAALDIRLRPSDEREPGLTPDVTTLWDEGAVGLEVVPALEALSRHFLVWINRWESDGFKPVHEAWLFRCDGYRKDVSDGQNVIGRFSGLDEIGNLILHMESETRVLAVQDYLHSEKVVSAMPDKPFPAGAA